MTLDNADEVKNLEAKAGTVRLADTAVEGEALVQVSGPDDSDIPLRSGSAEELVPHIITRLHLPSNEKVPFEMSDGEVQRKDFNERQVFGQKFFVDSTVDNVIENASYLFRVRWYGYSPMTIDGSAWSTCHKAKFSCTFGDGKYDYPCRAPCRRPCQVDNLGNQPWCGAPFRSCTMFAGTSLVRDGETIFNAFFKLNFAIRTHCQLRWSVKCSPFSCAFLF